MTELSPATLNEYSQAEEPARVLLERLGWNYVPREALAMERSEEREVLLKGRLRAAVLRLNDWLTEEQAERAIFDLEHVNEVGIARNQKIHEYLTFGLPLTVNTQRGQDTRNVRFFNFDHSEGGLNEFVVTTQFRVRRGNEKSDTEDDQRVIKPDLVLFVNGIPLVVMEAKSPSLLDVWKSQAVRQLRRYQEAGPEWHGTGAPELFHYNLLCVAHCGAGAAYAATGAPENAYFEWKSVAPYSDDEVRERFGVEPQGQVQLILGMLAPATLLDILRDFVVYEPEQGRVVKKLPRYQQYRAVKSAMQRILSEAKAEERGGVVWHTQGSGKSLTMLWLATRIRREPRLANAAIVAVTDRTQLDKQISETFRRCGFPAPERMGRSRPEPEERRARRRRETPNRAQPLDLQTVLGQGGGRTVMTTIQKFEEALTTPGGKLDVLNDSGNVFIMVDEAHRTQYGSAGRADVAGAAQRGDDRLHRHAHRQGIRPQHHEALRTAHRLLYHPAVGGRRRYRAHLVRSPPAGAAHRGAEYAWTSCSTPCSATKRTVCGRRYAAGTPTGGQWPRRMRAHPDDRPGHRPTLQGQGAAQRVQGPGRRPQPCRRPALRRAAERLRPQRLPHHHHRPQRRPRVPGRHGTGPGADHQRLRRPRGRAGGAGGG